MADGIVDSAPSREQLIHSLYEAAELEHNLMCTYLYAAFSLKSAGEGLSELETEAVGRWSSRRKPRALTMGAAWAAEVSTFMVQKSRARGAR